MVDKLAKSVQAPVPNLLDMFKKESGIEKGIDEKGAAGFFVVPGDWAPEPPVAFFVAVKDAKEFRSNFEVVKAGEKISEIKMKSPASAIPSGKPNYLAFVHGYAIFANHNKAALEAAVESKQSIAAEMAGYDSWLAENDANLIVTAAGVKQAAKEAQDDLKKAKADGAMPPQAAALVKSFQTAYEKCLETAAKEVALAMAGVRCDKLEGGVRVIGRARLTQGGTISKAIAQIPPLKENLFSGVSGGPFVVAAAGIGVPGLIEGYTALYGDLMKTLASQGGGVSPDDAARMTRELMEAFRQVNSMSFVWKVGKRSDPVYSNMHGTMKLEDSEKFLAAQEKYLAATGKMLKDSNEPTFKSIEGKRLQVAGKPALQMDMNFNQAGGQMEQAMMDEMLGPGGKMTSYYVADDKQTVAFGAGVPQERMVAALEVLKQPKKSLAEDAELSVTAAMLPVGSQWVFFVSPRGFVQLITRIEMAAMKNIPAQCSTT